MKKFFKEIILMSQSYCRAVVLSHEHYKTHPALDFHTRREINGEIFMNGFSILFLLFFLFNIGMECGITIIYNITTTSDGAYRNYFPLLEINPLVASHALSRFNAMHFKE